MAEERAQSQVIPPEPVIGTPYGPRPLPGWGGFVGFGGEPEPEVSDVGQAEAWSANLKTQFDTHAQALATMQQQLAALRAQLDAGAVADKADVRHERTAEEAARRRMEAGDNADRRLLNNPARLEAERNRDQSIAHRDQLLAHRLQWSEMVLNNQLTAFQQYNTAALRQAELAQAMQAAIITDGLSDARGARITDHTLAAEIVDSVGSKMETWQQNMNATLAKFIDAQSLVSQQMQALLGSLYGAVPPPATVVRESVSEKA